jgi:adenylate kinase family enzyme
LNIPYFDTDDYYWEKTDPPFQTRVTSATRNHRLVADLQQEPDWILGGSLDSWGDFLKSSFDCVVYLWLPKNIRAKRLIDREKERYGEALSKSSIEFIEWALAYDSSDRGGRNRLRHEMWMPTLPCPLLRIEKDVEVATKAQFVCNWIQQNNL